MHANRCHTCLKVLDWVGWHADFKLDLKQRLEKHGYVRKCCRRMMLTSIDNSEDVLGLLNTQRALDRISLLSADQKGQLFKRCFPASEFKKTPPAASPIATDPAKKKETPRSRVNRVHVCI